jgi:hypothetical protein
MVELQGEKVDTILKRLLELDVDLQDMVVRSANLEDVFLILTGRKLRE